MTPREPRPANNDDKELSKLLVEMQTQINQLSIEIKNLRSELDAPPAADGRDAASVGGTDAPLDIDKIAEAVALRLNHSMELTLANGETKLQTRPLNEPLKLIQRNVQIK